MKTFSKHIFHISHKKGSAKKYGGAFASQTLSVLPGVSASIPSLKHLPVDSIVESGVQKAPSQWLGQANDAQSGESQGAVSVSNRKINGDDKRQNVGEKQEPSVLGVGDTAGNDDDVRKSHIGIDDVDNGGNEILSSNFDILEAQGDIEASLDKQDEDIHQEHLLQVFSKRDRFFDTHLSRLPKDMHSSRNVDISENIQPANYSRGPHTSGLLEDVEGNTYVDDGLDVEDEKADWSPLVLLINSPSLFEKLTLVLSPVNEFLSPGFVIQHVRGNTTWLEEGLGAGAGLEGVDCYYTGRVLEALAESHVALSVCDGVVSTLFMTPSCPVAQTANVRMNSPLPVHRLVTLPVHRLVTL
ncbi:hypothetical protein PoB_001082900 [Plakobranchus ocellatus]|uniref:Peptidase M12B propeptide domain-containing protein n=1 Tax=Plakobranchus ocellatus TaxID=259542 RepID=A0AAV3YQJ6_9GAST|nr:hypothetical protein PoB_001082900 [Plakobranchus ocellatus]